MARTFVDRGGTFTDVVVVEDDGRARIRKVPSDEAVISELAEGALVFGTTVATNALLERTGVPTLLVVTQGFADLVRIGDMTRPELFDPDARWPDPLCERVVEVPGRIAADGSEVEPLVLQDIDLTGVEAVAVVLVNSHVNPAHEEAVAASLDGVHVTLGHRTSPEVGYLARIETALVDAAITPVLHAAMERDRIPSDALAMRSDGGLSPAPEFRAPDAVLSGPAGGVLAVAAVARQAGFERAVGLDMGGTSTDVCRVDGVLPRREGDVRVAGVRLRRPMLEVETIAAGGGSVLRSDGRSLFVGPESAGADPGPQARGRGGPPTLTDAALLAGLVRTDAFSPPLDPALVRLPADPEAFLDVAREAMAQAVRRIATARGVDLADHALVSYGGAAGQHACRVAEKLGVDTVLVHPCASVLSAWGQSLARREAADVRSVWGADWSAVESAWTELEESLPVLGDVLRTVELRHVGTDAGIEVVGATEADARAAFHAAHASRYGFTRDEPVELVNARVRVLAARPAAPTVQADPFGLGDGERAGPAVLFSPTTAVHVPPGWVARRADGLLRIERTQPRVPVQATERTPEGVALWGARFMAVAEQSGEVLRRLARSVNIRERRDFSCAVFDGRGRLVANAPHIPVHLGAMGETVRDLLRRHPDPPHGQAWLTNDPAAGGSHLPDLTVVTCVRAGSERFFVANRGHHVDVGGLTPGSMPPHSTTLADEGFVVRHVPLLDDAGGLVWPELACRQPDTVRADLAAQVAANTHAANALLELGAPEVLTAWMVHLHEVAREAVRDLAPKLRAGRAEDRVDGVPLVVRVDEALRIDFSGTGGPHPGNRNAPPAVVTAAVLYVLRCLAGTDLPLNEGARVPVLLPERSILTPHPDAAVVGGNVETSQRLVDLLFRALGERAASQGTMNNLTLGGDGWSLYETIGGGGGASAAGPGASGRQCHMTNTRATDPEVLEARLPVRVRRFAYRADSGGSGRHRGGDGLVRELEVLAPATAALLRSSRTQGPLGLDGGEPGAPGEDSIVQAGTRLSWDGRPAALEAGDRVCVKTPGGGGHGRTMTD
ncbi:MAG: 5-oxoprolinase [Proteobacteria bacterium]|nr:5-oxoprolinase [Pseudomonadota bacterium]